MKFNVKFTALAVSSVFVLSGLFTVLSPVSPTAPKVLKDSEKPHVVQIITHYGVVTTNSPEGLELAERVHRVCNTGESWYSTEPDGVCKARVMKELTRD